MTRTIINTLLIICIIFFVYLIIKQEGNNHGFNYTIEVTYLNGDKEILYFWCRGDVDKISLSDGNLYCSGTQAAFVRNYKLLNKEPYYKK